mgnify:CR=1 FL=1
MQIELTKKEFRRLLDLVYIGNWVLNSTRGDDRFADYDHVESKLFGLCREQGMNLLSQMWEGQWVPSQAFADGGIHEAIACYEDAVFYQILAEELSRRDMDYPEINQENLDELKIRMEQYMAEFQMSGVDKLTLEE